MYYYITRRQMREIVKNNSQRFSRLLTKKDEILKLFESVNEINSKKFHFEITTPQMETNEILLLYDYIDAVTPNTELSMILNGVLDWPKAFCANGIELECDDRILELVPKDQWTQEAENRFIL